MRGNPMHGSCIICALNGTQYYNGKVEGDHINRQEHEQKQRIEICKIFIPRRHEINKHGGA